MPNICPIFGTEGALLPDYPALGAWVRSSLEPVAPLLREDVFGGELRRRQIAERAMRPVRVVVDPSGLEDFPGLRQRHEDVLFESFSTSA